MAWINNYFQKLFSAERSMTLTNNLASPDFQTLCLKKGGCKRCLDHSTLLHCSSPPRLARPFYYNCGLQGSKHLLCTMYNSIGKALLWWPEIISRVMDRPAEKSCWRQLLLYTFQCIAFLEKESEREGAIHLLVQHLVVIGWVLVFLT